MTKGTIKRYDFRKGFGFIAEDKSGKDFFFHKSEWKGDSPIRKGIEVKFVGKDSDKGPQAESVTPLNGASSKPSKKSAPVAVSKPISIEDRVASLESSVAIWKVLSIVAFSGVIALAVEQFLL